MNKKIFWILKKCIRYCFPYVTVNILITFAVTLLSLGINILNKNVVNDGDIINANVMGSGTILRASSDYVYKEYIEDVNNPDMIANEIISEYDIVEDIILHEVVPEEQEENEEIEENLIIE